MTGRVLVVGEALVDVRVDERDGPGAGRHSEHPGGSPLNVAVGLGRLGVATTLAAQVGRDERGDAIAAHLEASGVELVRLPPTRRTATATATIGPDGAADYDFDLVWDPSELPEPAGCDAVHVGSIGAALAPGAEAVAKLVIDAATVGVPVSFDPNVRSQVTPDLDDVRRRVDTIASLATVVKLSDEDAAQLRPGSPVDRVVTELTGLLGVRLAVLTSGAGDLLISTGGPPVPVRAPSVRVVDTIGAGDTATAALLADLLARGLLGSALGAHRSVSAGDAEAVCRFAAAAAAVTCSRAGADPPWRSELDW